MKAEEVAPWLREIQTHEGCELRECRNRQEISIEWNTENDRPNLRLCRQCATVLSMRLMAVLVPPAS